MTTSSPSAAFVRDLYARMLLTRLVDDATWRLHEQGYIDYVARCRGHEAAQVGSAVCIEIGKDFTLPYYRDLGVVLTIGMTPLEVFRTHLQTYQAQTSTPEQDRISTTQSGIQHWGYQKHNTVTGSAFVATHILHAAGIAFACKLRKAPVVTVAYCGDGATANPDFREGIRFAAQHQLPLIVICEQNCSEADIFATPSCTQDIGLAGIAHKRIDGTHIGAVYTAMQEAMQQAREGKGPMLLEMCVTRSPMNDVPTHDPLVHCQQILQELHAWDDVWASQLLERLTTEVENALHNALQHQSSLDTST